jgi:hypothetical protein
MEERFLRTPAVEPERHTWPLDPRAWPPWVQLPTLVVAIAAVFAGAGALVAAAKSFDAVAGATWGLYGGGALLLFLGVAPFLSSSGPSTLGGACMEAEQRRAARMSEIAQTLLLLVAGAALIGLGLLVEVYG